jgi:hypothetical protein
MTSAILATSGMRAFDTDSVVTVSTAIDLYLAGYRCAIRYVSLVTPCTAGDLTAAEAREILSTALSLMLIQHCREQGWVPSAALGAQDAAAAIANAKAVGYPIGAALAIDVENTPAEVSTVVAYINAWCAAVTDGGYQPCLYYGADIPLTATQLYDDLIVERYWRDGSAAAPLVAVRGLCIQQKLPSITVAGLLIDEDTIAADALGGLPMLAVGT